MELVSASLFTDKSCYISAIAHTGVKSKYPVRYFCYGLLLANGAIYYGMTRQLIERITQHIIGNGAKITIKSKPKDLIYLKECDSKFHAGKLESLLHKRQGMNIFTNGIPEGYKNLFSNIQRAVCVYGFIDLREN
jgi:predicted GIY-YIG superfamily endonuclease